MKYTFFAAIAAGVLSAGVLTAPVAGQSKVPTTTGKVVINGWALNMSNTAIFSRSAR